MAPLLEGILLGLTLAVMLGPAFFALLQTSAHRGFRNAAIMALGIFLSDATLVYLSVLGSAQVFGDRASHLYFGIVAGIILIIFGGFTFTRKVNPKEEEKKLPENLPGPLTFLLKGYFLNITNPFLWIFWVSVVVSVSSNYGVRTPNMFVFFSGLLGTVLITDLIKAYTAHLIKPYLKPRILTFINRIVGIILISFGILLIARIGVGY